MMPWAQRNHPLGPMMGFDMPGRLEMVVFEVGLEAIWVGADETGLPTQLAADIRWRLTGDVWRGSHIGTCLIKSVNINPASRSDRILCRTFSCQRGRPVGAVCGGSRVN